MRKSFGNEATYTAWRRTLPVCCAIIADSIAHTIQRTLLHISPPHPTQSGKTEYKSITVARDVAPEEFNDFYLDDPVRAAWDSMLTSHESVARVADPELAAHRMQVVHWKRSFPFSFISARDYVIGRRTFRQHGNVYGITKSVEHEDKPPVAGVVRMVTYHSMWRCRSVPCPFGTDAPACETVLLHHEDFQIPENLARFAVRAGMGGFIKKMVPAVRPFVDARRQRVGPAQLDANAFGLEGVCEEEEVGGHHTSRDVLMQGGDFDGQQHRHHEDAASTTDDSLPELPTTPRSTTTPFTTTKYHLRRARTAPGALVDTMRHSPSMASLASSMGGGSSTDGASSSITRVGSVRKLATLALAAGVAVAVSQSSASVGVVRSTSMSNAAGRRRGRHIGGV